MKCGKSSVAVTREVESWLKKLTSNNIRLNSTQLGHIQATQSWSKSTRVDGVANFLDVYFKASSDGERVDWGPV
jgi:hypothetical protein